MTCIWCENSAGSAFMLERNVKRDIEGNPLQMDHHPPAGVRYNWWGVIFTPVSILWCIILLLQEST